MDNTIRIITNSGERVSFPCQTLGHIAVHHTPLLAEDGAWKEGGDYEISLIETGHRILGGLKQRKALKLAKDMYGWEEWQTLSADPKKAMKDFAFMRALRDKVYALRDEVAQ